MQHIDLPCTPQRVWREIQDPRADVWREPPAAFDGLGNDGDEPEMVEADRGSYTSGVSAPFPGPPL